MPYFPLFVNLAGSLCTLVGGGSVAERRVRTMLDFGVSLTVIAPEPSGTIRELAREGLLVLETREYAGMEDLRDAGLVIAAAKDRELNRRVAVDAQKAGILVNTADDPELCGFFFPALVRRGELVAGITSSGACPGLTARLREELDKSWPPNLGESLAALKDARQRLRTESSAGYKDGRLPEETGTGWQEGLNRLISRVVTKNS
ncbi:bifunctional precorrin-2 dehydrogenase/sirohydrochlorin ferrochelatase [Treponema sp. TIM-1]|uniref:precorrin-2 dehydrogenase/sirohydrochlorin ferrochelatase family protein n=1 Tax=Treponema sp. TIM-1 TaxID=2898417 RepID=UPI00397F11ED